MTMLHASAIATVLGLLFSTAAPAQDFPNELPPPKTKAASDADGKRVPSVISDAPEPPPRTNKKAVLVDPGLDAAEATPAALLKSLRDSLQVVADEGNPAEVRAAFRGAFDAILTNAEKAVKHPQATDAEKNEAYQFEASILYQGARKGELGFAERLERLADDLHRKQSKSDVANLANFLSVKARYEDDDGLRADSLPAIREYVKKYPHEEAAVDLLLAAAVRAEADGRPAAAKEALEIISATFKGHDTAAKIPAMLKRLDLVGKKLNLELSLMDGRKLVIDERKRVVIVDFWATTSPAAVAEQEILKDLYARFKDDGLEIVGVALDERESTVQQFLAKNKIAWPQNVIPFEAKDHGFNHPIAREYGVMQTPMNFLVENGKVVATQIRGQALGRKVEELVGKRSPTKTADRIGEPPAFK